MQETKCQLAGACCSVYYTTPGLVPTCFARALDLCHARSSLGLARFRSDEIQRVMLFAQSDPPFSVLSFKGAIHVQSSALEIAGNSTFMYNVAGVDGGEAVEAL